MDLIIQLLTDPGGFVAAHQLLLAQIGVNALLALSIYAGLASGVLSLASVGFMAIGAYVSVLLEAHLQMPFALAAAIGTLAAGAVALPIGIASLRLSGIFLAIATLGFAQVVVAVILNLPITGEGRGQLNLDADTSLLPAYISLAVITYVLWRLGKGRIGQAWAAVREDSVAAAAHGVNVFAYELLAFITGSLLAGYTGALDAHLNFFIDPSQYPFTRVVSALIFTVVGGTFNVFGPIVGAAVLTTLPEIARFAKDYRDAVDGVVLLAVIL
ncbi:MAG TPA: branched-chain amino acid ABC transporter permease, partial [Candidatus Sulfotelmatobacter sp.]|nr:branched-chain amino acid ABC transporter permease [Candidatus Sulfotelmatobacter sp.]